jgi:signal transduction histidine kinase
MRTTSLAWALGTVLAGAGTFMLVAPHRFSAPAYDLLRPALAWWGIAFCLAGVSLLASPVYALARWTRIIAHLLAAAVLGALACSFANAAIWDVAAAHALLVAAILYAGLSWRRLELGGDLLTWALGGMGIVHGGVLLVGSFIAPAVLHAPFYDTIRPVAPVAGVLACAAGLALITTQNTKHRTRRGPAWWKVGAQFAAGALCIAFAAKMALENGAFTVFALYGGMAILVGLSPMVSRDESVTAGSSSLRARLALALAVAAALPLMSAATLIAQQEERAALDEALARQQTLAEVLAQDAAQYIRLHRNAIAALARQISELSPDAVTQAALLRSAGASYPAFGFIGTYSVVGSSVASSDARAPEAIARLPVFEDARAADVDSIDVMYRPELSPGPVFTLASPIVHAQRFDGVVLGAVESTRFAALLAAPRVGSGGETYLVDARGRAIAHPDTALSAALADFSSLPPVKAVLESESASVPMRYRSWGGERLVGYARVPELGWGVIVERPVSLVLGDSYARRDLIFTVLLLAIGAAGAAGWAAAGRLTRSLSGLARAADALAAEDLAAPLPRSSTAELARLASAFGAMRDRLAARTAEREEAIRMRDNVLGTVSHDLKSPLTTIALRAHILQDQATELLQEAGAAAGGSSTPGGGSSIVGTPGNAPGRGLERLVLIGDGMRRILATTNRMQSMIDELVDTARLHTGQSLDLNRRPIDLAALTALVVEEYRQTAERHRIVFEAPDQDLIGVCDHARLERVLHNLLGNAVKYSPDGGKIAVTVRRLSNNALGGETGCAAISVTDEGLGIPAAELPQLFQRFFRASNVTERIRGTGLGLYSARHIVMQHGGTLEVRTSEGQGSTFTISLPLSTGAAVGPATPDEAASSAVERPATLAQLQG